MVFQTESAGKPNRRSVYLLARRTWPLTFLAAFDFPVIDTACTRRVPSATPLQSLTLMNSGFVTENAQEAAKWTAALVGDGSSPHDLVEAAYGLLLSREPSRQESEIAVDHLESQQQLYAKANSPQEKAFQKSLENLVHMLIS